MRSRALAPDADESITRSPALARTRRRCRQPCTRPASRSRFSGAGLRDPRDFVRNVARAVREGLGAEAALRAMTADAARIAGVAERLGTLEKGRIANLLVTEGDLFDERMKIRHVFVDGRLVQIDDAPAPAGTPRRPRRTVRRRGLTAFACLGLIAVLSGSAVAQQPAPSANRLRVFLDCDECDSDYVRREIEFIDYVRDRTEADLHILVTTQETASGGEEWVFKFIGLGRFNGLNDELKYTSLQTSTDDEERAGYTRHSQARTRPIRDVDSDR